MARINLDIATIQRLYTEIEGLDATLIDVNLPKLDELLSSAASKVNNEDINVLVNEIKLKSFQISLQVSKDLENLEVFLKSQIKDYETAEEVALQEINKALNAMKEFALSLGLMPKESNKSIGSTIGNMLNESSSKRESDNSDVSNYKAEAGLAAGLAGVSGMIAGSNANPSYESETSTPEVNDSPFVEGTYNDGYTGGTTGIYKNNEAQGFVVTTDNPVYNVSDEDFELLCAIVSAESDHSHDDALAVMSTILNRCESESFQGYGGANPVKQATYPSQFVVYEKGAYRKYMNGNAPETVVTAVRDALNGYRNHNYISFRSNDSTGYSSNMISPTGNRYK